MVSSNGATTPQQLGDYICNANPYTKKKDPVASLPTPMDLRLAGAEVDNQSNVWPHREWPFKQATYHVSNVVRIPCHYIDRTRNSTEAVSPHRLRGEYGGIDLQYSVSWQRSAGRMNVSPRTNPTP
jgi:hypothetical protein